MSDQLPLLAYRDLELYRDRIRRLAAEGHHRAAVGDLWDTLGSLVAGYLRAQGLQPDQRVLDVGCGCLRIGLHLIEFLDKGNYYGIDQSQELLDAGYDIELAATGLQAKVPREHLVRSEEFNFGQLAHCAPFDVALAQSVFTHLPIGHLRLCLARLAPITKPRGVFHVTVFVVPGIQEWLEPALHDPGGITTHPVRNPYHHTFDDLVHAAKGLPWSVDDPRDISHPRGQAMVRFIRVQG